MKKSLLVVFSITLMLFFGSSIFAQNGQRVKVANNNELIKALDNPNVTSIEITQDGFYDAINDNAISGTVITKDGDGALSCTLSITTTNVCFTGDPTTNSATAGTSGDPSCPPQPTTGAYGWSSTNPEITFNHIVDQYEYTTNFEASSSGAYTVRYTWDDFNYAEKSVYFFDIPEVTDLQGDTVCGLTTTITFDYDMGFTTPDTTVTWTVNGADSSSVYPKEPGTFTFTAPACGAYTLNLTVENSIGCGSDDSTIYLYFYDEATANAGTDDSVCGLTYYSLAGGYSGGTCYIDPIDQVWTLDASFANAGTATFYGSSPIWDSVEVSNCGEYQFVFTTTNGLCVDSDTMAVYFYDTPVVDAGMNDTICGLDVVLAPSYTVSCDDGVTPTVAWTKSSGPGSVTFDADTATVSVCGTYVLEYTVTNGLCVSSDSIEVHFSDEPVIINTFYPDTICGFDSDEFHVYYTVGCSLGSDTAIWTTNSTHATIAAGMSTDMWIASTDTCGTFEYYYTVYNYPCIVTDTFTITFFQTPDPSIIGDTIVFTCSTETYEIVDNTCNDFGAYTFTWNITEGLFENGTITTTGNPVDVTFNPFTIDSELTVHASFTGVDMCDGYDTITITKELPTLEGQVKYWNEFETYMPSPFSTEVYSSYPFDYFYVILLADGVEVDTAYVQPRLMEDLTELMSYFDFTLDTETLESCDIEYTLKIWDGSLTYHTTPAPPAEEVIIGAAYTYNEWGGVNATDALAIQLMVGGANDINGAPWNYTWVGVNTDVPQYGYYSHGVADVNSTNTYVTGGITALDALTAKYRAVGLLGSYPDNGSNNQFTPNFRVTGRMVDSLPQITWTAPFDYDNVNDIPFTHSGTDYMYFSAAIDHKYASDSVNWGGKNNYINLYYESIGDVNASYVPPGSGLKATSNVELTYEGLLSANVGSEMTIPVSIDRDAEIGAVTLSFNYRNDLIEVLGTNYADDDMFINQESGILNIAWFNTQTLELNAEAAIVQIRVRIIEEIPEGTKLFNLNAITELADANANPISDINLKTKGVSTSGIANLTELTSSVYPNPSNDVATITYTLPEAGTVKVDVYNNTGVLVATLVDMTQEAGLQNAVFNTSSVQAGVYIYHITVQGETTNFSAVKRMIVVH